MQQSQAVVSLLLWGTTITLLVWPLINWRFTAECSAGPCFPNEFFGISSTYFALTVIFFTVMFAVLTIGFLYDQVFSLWTEYRNVDMERNPFATYALAPIWVMTIALQAEVLKRTSPDDEAMIQQADCITLHLPLTESTRNMFDAEKMKSHLSGIMDGKIGNLAKEIADVSMSSLNLLQNC